MLRYWAWESQIIRFNPNGGATTAREIQIKHLKEFGEAVLTPESIVGSMNSRSYLSYKTASFAAMFIGENPERAGVLDSHAERALERVESISNKGRQQIMTRHRPFRAAFKARGGW
jgi:RNA-splicing ligase RtcB